MSSPGPSALSPGPSATPPPPLLRQHSGKNEKSEDVYMVRSLAIIEGNTVKYEEVLHELFNGINRTAEGKFYDLFAYSSTVVLNENTPVGENNNYATRITIPSQLYPKDNISAKQNYTDVTSIKDYFNKRESLKKNNKIDKLKKTWLGSPSLIFKYVNREILSKYFKDTIINIIFWITMFHTLKNYLEYEKENEVKYCDKYPDLKDKLNKIQEAKTINGANPHEKFATNFGDCISRILSAEAQLNANNEKNETNYYQRSNEMFSFFFPWDLHGIERGAVPDEEFVKFYHDIKRSREKTIGELEFIFKNGGVKFEKNPDMDNYYVSEKNDDKSAEIIEIINDIITLILNNNFEEINKTVVTNKYTYTLFLIAKYILSARCNQPQYAKNQYKLTHPDDTDIFFLFIREIIILMKEPVRIYEYVLQPDKLFKMIETDSYSRTSPFYLFEQELGKNTVVMSNMQLDPATTNSYTIPKQEAQIKSIRSKLNAVALNAPLARALSVIPNVFSFGQMGKGRTKKKRLNKKLSKRKRKFSSRIKNQNTHKK
jgi:hypothetical protein